VFGIKYRYVFFLLLAVYSYLNISFTVGEKLFDFYIQPLYLFAILAVVVLGIWELNRLTERKLEKLHALAQQRIHPLIILFCDEYDQCSHRFHCVPGAFIHSVKHAAAYAR
jgi:hypothetical protein